MANQLIFALPRVTDSNGDPASGALAYFYQTGTTSPVTVYTDTGLSVAHASPVVADSGGAFAQVFYGGATDVKVVVKTSAGVTLYQYDPCPMITGVSSAAEGISFSPITGNAATNVQDAIAINTQAIAGAIPETRSISAGTGLTGGGDLSANRTIAIDEADAAALTAGTDGKFPDAATIRADIDTHGITQTSGAAPYYGARAWASFNGTTGAIYASGNVASVTRNSAGDYTITFSTNMPDANYAVLAMAREDGTGAGANFGAVLKDSTTPAVDSFTIATGVPTAGSFVDSAYVFVAVFR